MSKNVNNKKLDTYFGLCTEVYELSKPKAPSDAYAFYLEYVKVAKGPNIRANVWHWSFSHSFLLEEGFDVYDFDVSDNMLERFYEKARAKGLKTNVWNEFAQDFVRFEKYNLIFIPSGSFCLITDLHEAKVTFKKFYNYLNNDGIFLFEAETLQAVPQQGVWHGSICGWPKPNGQMIISSSFSMMKENICNTIGKYELVEKNQIIYTEVEEYNVRIYQHDQLMEMLKAVGFNNVRILKAFDHKKQPDEQDKCIVYECKK